MKGAILEKGGECFTLLKNISTCAVGFFNNKGNFRHTDLKVCLQIL